MPPNRVRDTIATRRMQRRNQLISLAAILVAENENKEDEDSILLALIVLQMAMDETRSLRYGARPRPISRSETTQDDISSSGSII